jgi:hypothetical protein
MKCWLCLRRLGSSRMDPGVEMGTSRMARFLLKKPVCLLNSFGNYRHAATDTTATRPFDVVVSALRLEPASLSPGGQ